jgi:hypothetical protein
LWLYDGYGMQNEFALVPITVNAIVGSRVTRSARITVTCNKQIKINGGYFGLLSGACRWALSKKAASRDSADAPPNLV